MQETEHVCKEGQDLIPSVNSSVMANGSIEDMPNTPHDVDNSTIPMEPTKSAKQTLGPALTQAEPVVRDTNVEEQWRDSESFQNHYPASDADSAVGSV